MMPDHPESIRIETLKAGQEIESTFLVNDLKLLQAKNGQPYLSLKVKDRSGQMEARIWDRATELFSVLEGCQVAWIRGVTYAYQNTLQIKITDARPVNPEHIDLDHLIATSPREIEGMFAELTSLARSIGHPQIQALVLELLSDPELARRFKIAPAAKRFHHDYRGGLLEHTLAVTRAAAVFSTLYPDLNRDLLLAGAIIHDLGKIREFDLGLSGDYTTEGRLLGHIFMGAEMLDPYLSRLPGFDPQLALLLKHLILSHHGEYEFGSPKRPKILEGLVLHYLDDLDAKMHAIAGYINSQANQQTGWTPYHQKLERYFFRPDLPRFEPVPGKSEQATEAVAPSDHKTEDFPEQSVPPDKPSSRPKRPRPAADLCQPLFPDLSPDSPPDNPEDS